MMLWLRCWIFSVRLNHLKVIVDALQCTLAWFLTTVLLESVSHFLSRFPLETFISHMLGKCGDVIVFCKLYAYHFMLICIFFRCCVCHHTGTQWIWRWWLWRVRCFIYDATVSALRWGFYSFQHSSFTFSFSSSTSSLPDNKCCLSRLFLTVFKAIWPFLWFDVFTTFRICLEIAQKCWSS